jgi:SAM-dependent methyltransferase
MSSKSFAADLTTLSLRDQRTVVGHATLNLMSPLSEEVLTNLIATVPPKGKLLDVGAGKAALARQLLKHDRDATAICIERNPVLAAQAEEQASQEGFNNRIKMIVTDAQNWRSSDVFDAVAVLGASRALEGIHNVLAFARTRLRTGGILLLGEGLWVAPPVPEYLKFLGTDGSDTLTEEALKLELQSAGFILQYAHISSDAEWEAYEASYFQSLKSFSTESGERPFAREAEAFEDMQRRFGRKSLGFIAIAATRADPI